MNKTEIVRAAAPVQIAPAYSKAIAQTAQHYQTMISLVLSCYGASEFFTQDLEEMGGVR